MPSPMVHLSIARNIAEMGFELGDLSQFYLGSISPDAIHMRPNYDRFAKRKTHLTPILQRRVDVDEIDFVKFLTRFIITNKNKADIDFLWGYSMHVLTDVYWIKHVGLKFAQEYIKDLYTKRSIQQAYYSDIDILDHILFNESIWKDNVWQHLQVAESSDFLDLLTAREINLWKERTLCWYDSSESRHKNQMKYIIKLDIEDFILICSKTIANDFSFSTHI